MKYLRYFYATARHSLELMNESYIVNIVIKMPYSDFEVHGSASLKLDKEVDSLEYLAFIAGRRGGELQFICSVAIF